MTDPDWADRDRAGSANDSIPAILRRSSEHEPMWVDVRGLREDTAFTRDNEPFRSALAQLAGPIRGMTRGEVIGEDYRQFRRTIWTAWSVAVALVLLLVWAIVALYAANIAREDALQQARIARSRQLAAEALTNRKDSRDLALLLSAAAFDVAPTSEAKDSLLTTLEYSRHLSLFFHASRRQAG